MRRAQLYQRRRAAGQCVRCGEPAALGADGKPLAHCARHRHPRPEDYRCGYIFGDGKVCGEVGHTRRSCPHRRAVGGQR